MAKSLDVPGLTIQFWRTGLYTHRSQLFAPMRTLGISVVQMRDALIDGQDMEVTDLLEIQRRPGFSRFCSVQLAGGEIINQFYSQRNASGTVYPLIDTNQRVASFSSSAITTFWTKPTGDQSFPFLVQNQWYICNGTTDGQKRYDTSTAALHGMGILGPTNMPTLAPPTAAGPSFWQPNINFSNTQIILLDPNGNIQGNSAFFFGAANLTTGTQPPAWNPYQGGFTSDGTSTWANFGPPQIWVANKAWTTPVSIITDSNGNFQVQTNSGTSGATAPAWSAVVGNNTVDNTITWKCCGTAIPIVFSGFIYVYTYSTQAPTVASGYYHCSTASPVTYITGTIFSASAYNQAVKGAYSTNPDVASVDIYRIKDGGSILNYAGSVVNNTGGGTWTFNDNITDAALNTSITIPLQGFRQNDVPPGTTGSLAPSTDKLSYLTFWMGRLWGVAGNKVYFDAGADCQNGDPHASWPPANVFTFPGSPIALVATTVGLLVFLANQVKIIAGGPQTLTFYSADLMENFGISSPNAISKDGDTVRVLSTQGQQFTLTVSEKIEDGNFVADLIASNFAPASSYLTTHRNGLDSGVFLGDGSSNILRYGLNIGAWSTIYKPVNGIKALRSIETSTGRYTLCAGRASAAGFILGRDLTAWQDDGQNYTDCFTTIGNLVLSEPRQQLVDLHYVILYMNAVGSIPSVYILPNEVSGTSGIGFINLPNVQNEPTTGAAPSTTLMSKQWEVRAMQTMATSIAMHHLQVKIKFPKENIPNTIKLMSLKFGEDP